MTVGNYVEDLVECFLCGKQNNPSAAECKECNGPIFVSEQYATDPDKQPNIIVALGAPAVGKSVYLGMLLENLARGNDLDVRLDGADSTKMQHHVMLALSRGAFPENGDDVAWNWGRCLWGKGRKAKEVLLPDFPALPAIEDYEGRRDCPVISYTIRKSVGLMLFIDAAAVHRGDADEEYFALHLLRYYTDAFRIPIDETDKPRKRKVRVAFVLAKSDQSKDCLDAPDDFVRSKMPELWKACKEQLSCYKFFPTSVAGVCVSVDSKRGYKTEVPLRVEPRGIQDPFRWMLQQI